MKKRLPQWRWLSFALIVSLVFFAVSASQGQDVEQVVNSARHLRGQSLQINGGLSLSNQFYLADGIDPRRDALQWRVLANLNFRFLGLEAPFSLAFSDANREFNLPSYTFVGISPTYKWAKLHLGDRSLNFSKYTLNSINFRGAGFEIKPGKWYAAGMYGQLRRAVAEDLNSQQMLEPAYKRIGYGLKLGVSERTYEYQVIFFGAHDDENSITQPVQYDVLPSENAVVSLNGRQQLTKTLSLEAEMARSAFNRDRRLEDLPAAEQNWGNTFVGIFQPNTSVTTGNAYRAKLNYQVKGLGLNAGYERIDRGFRTMGALFFLSDVDYITAGFNKRFFKNKLTLFANGGLERTNLDDFERNGTKRLVGSFNAAYAPSDKWNFNGSYSNFQNTTKLRTLTDPTALVDSIILAQTTQSASGVATYNIRNKENPSSISVLFTYQLANSIIDDVVQPDSKTRFFNGSLLYALTLSERDLRLSAALNANRTEVATLDNFVLAPTLGLTKSFLNKSLQLNTRAAYNLIFEDGGGNSQVINLTVGSAYQFFKMHTLSFNTTVISRAANSQSTVSKFLEWYGQLMYSYRFLQNIKFRQSDASSR